MIAAQPVPKEMRRPTTIDGQRCWENHFAEQGRLRIAAKHLPCVHHQWIDAFHARNRGQQRGEKGADAYDENFARFADAKPQDGQRDPRKRRNRPKQLDYGVDDAFEAPRPAHRQSKRDRDSACQEPGGEHAPQARARMHKQSTTDEQRPEFLRRKPGRRQQRDVRLEDDDHRLPHSDDRRCCHKQRHDAPREHRESPH